MDYEEYKRKALEPIVNYIESVMDSYSKEEIEARIKKALPEKESEDERIRKILISIVKDACDKGVKYEGNEIGEEKLLAYLEKQKEQKPFPQEIFDTAKHEALWGEQKPAEWSKEDEKRINSIFNDFKQDVVPDEEDQEWLKNRLKSLRPQPKQKRKIKEGDKVIIHCRKDRKEGMITIFDGKVGEVINVWDAERNPWGHIGVRLNNGCNNGFYEDELEVFGEPHWKPSKEQIEALWKLMHSAVHLSNWNEFEKPIEAIYNGLKKL